MAFLASIETIDTSSASPVPSVCLYPAAPIGGAPMPTKVIAGGQPLMIIAPPVGGTQYVCAPTVPIPVDIAFGTTCQPGVRFIRPTVNTSVIINGMLPAVTGDDAQLLLGGTPRPLTGPFQHPTIIIGSNLTP